MNSEEDLSQQTPLVRHAVWVASKYGWLGPISLLAAVITSFWLLYLIFTARGFLTTLVAFFLLGISYRLGPAPMFAVASSILCFYFHAVGIWLPVISYVIAAITLYLAILVIWTSDR